MLIRIDDHGMVDELCAHFRRSGFDADFAGGGMIDVAVPNAASAAEERRAVLAHLRVWEVLNPDSPAEIVD